MLKNNYKKKYYFIFFIFLIINIVWIATINTQPFSDFEYYHILAKQIAHGGSWGDTYTSIGYSIFLSIFYKIFGSNVLVGKILNLILSLVSIILFKKILNFTSLNEKGKFIVFTLFTLFPSTIFYNSILGTEILFTFLVLLITYLFFKENIKFKYIYIGILTGIATMIKPFFILYFFAIFLYELIFKKNMFKTIKNSLLIFIISILILAPWLYRNTKYNGEFTYVSNNGGIVLYINNNSQNTNGRWMPASNVENSIVNTKEYKNATMTQKNKMLSKAAKKWIKTHPKKFIILGFKRLGNVYFIGDDISYSLNGSDLNINVKLKIVYVYALFRAIIFFMAICYILYYSFYIIVCLIKRSIDKLDKFNVYLCILFYMFTCVYFITEGQARYAFPIIFILCYSFYKSINIIQNTKKLKN